MISPGHSRQASQEHAKSIALMKFLSGIARRLGVSEHVYVVGGAVRNFVLREPIKDIDVVIDVVSAGKDSEWFAKEVIKALPVPANYTTNQYGVAIITVKGDWLLDGQNLAGEIIEIANTRSESYTEGGYKPESVSPATIEEDLARREFTFNTLLWRMHDLADGPDKAEILDLTGCGLRDLQDGVMRCPTNPDKTFSDDASRMVRAIKFLIKYGFKIAPDVEASIRRNRQKLKNVKASHLSKLLLDFVLPEATGKKALVEMERLGLLDVVKEIAQTNTGFRQTLSNRADEVGVPFLFTLMDFGLPSGKRLTFLPSGDRERVRSLTSHMTRDEGMLYVERLASPKLDNRALMAEFGLAGKAMGQVRDTARRLMLLEPELASDPAKLTDAVRSHLSSGKQARLLPVTEWQEALGKLAADAKFKSKKEVPKAEGKGTTTVYEYSERQVANRNHAKAEKIEKLRGSIDKLRAQVKKDLTAGDEDTRLTALAVGLMDETFERVGNEESAKEGHYGVTGWLVKHVTLGKGKATVKYVGKSGVSHDKTVEDKGLLAALNKAVEGKKPGDSLTGTIGAEDVNTYLEPFDITAKDLRGYHANTEMQQRLKAIRSEGGKLPEDKKEREKKLKDEFKKALAESAEAVGHEAATLRTQYLVPGLEEAFMKDGTVEAKLDKQGGILEAPPKMVQDITAWVLRVIGSETLVRVQRDREAWAIPDGREWQKAIEPGFVSITQAEALSIRADFLKEYDEVERKALHLRGAPIPMESGYYVQKFPLDFQGWSLRQVVEEGLAKRRAEDPKSLWFFDKMMDPMTVVIYPDLRYHDNPLVPASWRGGQLTFWGVPTTTRKKEFDRNGRDVAALVRHELQHLAQDVLRDATKVPMAGAPRKKTPPGVLTGLPWSQQHHLKEDEFYTDLQDQVEAFPQFLRDQPSKVDLRKAVEGFLAESSFFRTLKKWDPTKWQKAVKEFWKALKLANPTMRVAQDMDSVWAPVLLTLQWKKLATKSTAEKEDEEAERLVRSPPKKKPPRKDLRRERVQDEDTDDGSERPGADTDPDLSLNYKRVAQLHLGTYAIMLRQAVVQPGDAPKPPKPKGPPKAKKPKPTPKAAPPPKPEGSGDPGKHKPGDVEESKATPGNWVAWHPTETWDNGQPKFHTFKKDEDDPKGNAELYAKGELEVEADSKPASDDDDDDETDWSKEQAAAKRKEQSGKEKAKAQAKERAQQVLQAVGTLKDSIKTDTVPKHMQEGFLERAADFSEDDWKALGEAFGATIKELGETLSDGEPYTEEMMEVAGDALAEKLPAGASPHELGQLLAEAMVAQQVITNPKLVGGKSVSGTEKSDKDLKERSQEAYSQYAKATPELRRSAADQINQVLKDLPEGSNERKEYESIRMGLSLAMVAEGEKPTDSNNRPISRLPSKKFSNTVKMLAGQGRMRAFLEAGGVLHTAEGRKVLRDTISKLDSDDDAFVEFAGGSKGPNEPLLTLLKEEERKSEDLSPKARESLKIIRGFIEDDAMFDATTGDALLGVAFEKVKTNMSEREQADLQERIEKSLGSLDENLAKLNKDLAKCLTQAASATGADIESAKKRCADMRVRIVKAKGAGQISLIEEHGGELPVSDPLAALVKEVTETGDMSNLDKPTVPAGETPESYAEAERKKQLALDELEKIPVSEPERSREDAADIDKTFDKGEKALAPEPEEPEADKAEGEKKPGEDKAEADKAEKPDEAEKPEADKKPEPSEDKAEKPKIKRPENWRADEGEVELHSKDDFDSYSKEHTVKTPAGSVMLGVHHLTDDPEDVGNVYFKERVIPEATKAVEEALKNGKKPVFLAEGEAQDYDLDVDEDYSEQHALAKALHKEFGDKVKQDTWDDDSVSPYDLKSKLWESLTSAAGGDQTKAQTAMMAFMLGQNDSPDVWREKGILTDAVAKSLKDQFGVDVDNLDDAGKKKLFEQAFPRDSGKPETEISAVGDAYNAARQENLLKRMKEIEADGGAAIVIPGGTHAWNLKPVVEKGGEGKAEKPSEEKKPKAEKKPEAPSKEQTAEAELEAKKEKEEPHKEGEAWKTENGHWAYKDDKGNIQVILKSEENAKEKAEARAKGKDFEPEGGAEDKAKKLGFVGVRELSNAWGKVLQRSEGLTSFQSFPYRRSDISRGPICARALSPSKGDTKMPLTKEGAQKVTSRLDEIASAFQKNYETWGIPKRIAADFCMRCDMLSDAMEKMAGIKRQALTEYDPVKEPTAIGGEDPELIGENKGGPLRHDSDESFMKGEFTQQENRELRTRVEKKDLGMKPNLEELTIPAGRQARRSIDSSIDRLAKQAGEVHIRTLGALSDDLKVAAARAAGSVAASVNTLSGMVGKTRDLLITANAQGKASSALLNEVETVTTAANEVLPYVSDMKTAGADATARIGQLVDLAVKVAAASGTKIQAALNA